MARPPEAAPALIYVDDSGNVVINGATIPTFSNAMTFKGVIDCSGNPNYPAGEAGDTYRVSVAGKIGGASGTTVEVGDIVICNTDATIAGTQAAQGTKWNVIQTNVAFTANALSLVTAADYAAMKVLLSLGNVDNTSDANKPVSTAQQAALNLKVDGTPGVKVYRALLTQAGDGATTATSGLLEVGKRYEITTYVAADDFTNVGAASNANGVQFIATGTTPTVWTEGSTLTDTSAPVATVLENSLGGAVVWTRAGLGNYAGTLAGAFPAAKTSLLPPGSIGADIDGNFCKLIRTSDNVVNLYPFSVSEAGPVDDALSGTLVQILVYP